MILIHSAGDDEDKVKNDIEHNDDNEEQKCRRQPTSSGKVFSK